MTQKEFKEILESIEVGLYEKWEKNWMDSNPRKKLNVWLKDDIVDHICGPFVWFITNEGIDYWYDVHDKYETILKERSLI